MNPDQVRRIESAENKTFKSWLQLHESQGVKKQGRFLLSGLKLVNEALEKRPFKIEALVLGPDDISDFDGPTYQLTKPLFKELDLLGTRSPLIIGELPNIPEWTPTETKGLEIFLALQDPGNLGSALRLASAFNVDHVILLKESAHPFHPRSLKAASGASYSLSLSYGPTIHHLEDEYWVLDQAGKNIADFKWPKNLRLVLGEEGRGIPAHLKNTARTLTIPINENVESLNATHALAIALHSWSTQK